MAFEAYMASRADLLTQERSMRRDYTYKANMSATEAKAEEIVRRLRKEEADTIWCATHEDIPHLFPGMEFLTARSIIESTKLFKLLRKMPKGAMLHAHLDATVDVSLLLKIALEHPAIHVRTSAHLTADEATRQLPEFRALPLSEYGTSLDIADPNYIPGTWIPLKEARQACSLGVDAFDRWVIQSMTINPTEAYETHNTVTKIWQKFGSVFMVSQGIIRYVPIFEQYIREFFLSSIRDGIMYVEPRINFLHRTMTNAKGENVVTHEEWLEVFDRVVQQVKDELKTQGREDEFFGARIIYSTIRFLSEEELEWYLEDCIMLKQKYPHLIAGFDLVGDENILQPLTFYLKPLLRFRERQKDLGIDIPFIFHAGETLGDGNHVDDNLFDAILLGTKRIGHGWILAGETSPPNANLQRKRNSIGKRKTLDDTDYMKRLTSSMPMHPLPSILNNGIPVALSSDDPAIFGNLDLSYDFYQVLVASEINGLITLAIAARDSLEFSTLEESEKKRAMAIWEKRWATFVETICSE